ncbi:Argininosuccinate lyase 1 [compost metagenome]
MREVPILDSAFTSTQGSLQLMTAMVATLTVNEARMAQAANENWSTATNLADRIVREGNLSFREAHSLVARLVRECVDQGIPVGGVTAELLRHAAAALDLPPPGLSTDAVRGCLDARAFVQTRTSTGATAAPRINELTQSAIAAVAEQQAWLQVRTDKLAAATAARARAVEQWSR